MPYLAKLNASSMIPALSNAENTYFRQENTYSSISYQMLNVYGKRQSKYFSLQFT